jgi:hypothetical protein
MKKFYICLFVVCPSFVAYGGSEVSKIASSTPGRIVLGAAAGGVVAGIPGQALGAAVAVALDPGQMPDLPEGPSVPDESEQKANELRRLYNDFIQLNRNESTSAAVRTFMMSAAQILLKYSRHISIAQEYLEREIRPAHKVSFACLVYLAEPNSQMAGYLNRDLGLPQHQIDRLHQIRVALQNQQGANSAPAGVSVQRCMLSSDSSESDEWLAITQEIISRL